MALFLSLVFALSALPAAASAAFQEADRKAAEADARAVLDKTGWNFKSAYDWCVKNITYKKGTPSDNSNYGVDNFARYGFEHKKGNCYTFASCLYEMGKLLNVDIHVIHGKVLYRNSSYGPHAWNEVDQNGKTYVCDAEYEKECIQQKRSHISGYMFPYKTKGTWKYANGK